MDSPFQDVMPQFIPFSLFPPIYVHDISFSLTTDTTERRFFQAIHDITGNMVSDVFFRERYIDEVKDQVSYNYRMIYCRCDGPLSHVQTVEMQNKLRLLLLDLNFQLS
jgi:phenylalanyl-tRNA synthetase beta subunit